MSKQVSELMKRRSKRPKSQPIRSSSSSKSHRSRKKVAIVIVAVVILVLVVSVIVYSTLPVSPEKPEKVTLTALHIEIQYNDSSQDFFGPRFQAVSIGNQPNQVLVIDKGQQFSVSFPFSESQSATGNHTVNNITATTLGFSILAVDPGLPINLSPGAYIAMTLAFQAPNSTFTGAVEVIFSPT